MAVEASHITLFPPPNREIIYQGNGRSMYDDELQTACGSKTEKIIPVYDFQKTDSFPAPVFKAISGRGLNSGLPLSRKRPRESFSFNPVPFSVPNVNRDGHRFGEFTFLGGDISSQICQQQLEVDLLIAQHTEKVRAEIGEIRKQNTRRLISAIHETIMKRLKTKEDEYLKIRRLNWSLEENVKSLSIENQMLKELVQTNEATANALRNKLQQVQLQQQHHNDNVDLSENDVDDAQSYCGSNSEEDHRQVAEDGGRERKVIDAKGKNDENEDCNTTRTSSSRYGRLNRWWCRKCEKMESCVLLLPCRHLCVCTVCVSSISFCPVCNATKSAGVHVNMSSS